MFFLELSSIFSQVMSFIYILSVIKQFASRSIMDVALDDLHSPTHPINVTASSFICSNCDEEEATLICEQLKTVFCYQCSQSFSFCIPCRSLHNLIQDYDAQEYTFQPFDAGAARTNEVYSFIANVISSSSSASPPKCAHWSESVHWSNIPGMTEAHSKSYFAQGIQKKRNFEAICGVEITGSKYENRRLSFSNTSSVSATFLPAIIVDVCTEEMKVEEPQKKAKLRRSEDYQHGVSSVRALGGSISKVLIDSIENLVGQDKPVLSAQLLEYAANRAISHLTDGAVDFSSKISMIDSARNHVQNLQDYGDPRSKDQIREVVTIVSSLLPQNAALNKTRIQKFWGIGAKVLDKSFRRRKAFDEAADEAAVAAASAASMIVESEDSSVSDDKENTQSISTSSSSSSSCDNDTLASSVQSTEASTTLPPKTKLKKLLKKLKNIFSSFFNFEGQRKK